ncbi:MAG TPA: hypothetical protein VHE53_01795 [Patescibacteria group bacterium]|nr:hypothetical protein [Patescibacteria group bacterium]
MTPEDESNNLQEANLTREGIYTKTFVAPLPYFLPGIDADFIEEDLGDGRVSRKPRRVDRFAKQELEVASGIDDQGIEHYRFKLATPFLYRDARNLIYGLSGNRRKGLEIGKEKEDELIGKLKGLIPVSHEYLESVSERLYTVDRALSDFLRNSEVPRRYEALWKEQDPDRDVSGFIGEIAEMIKSERSFWGGRDVSRASDADAVDLFKRLRSDQRLRLLSNYLSQFNEKGRQIFLESHMSLIHNAKPLKKGGETVGFLEGTGSIMMPPRDGEWVTSVSPVTTPGDPREDPIYISIKSYDSQFVLSADKPDSLSVGVSWTKSGVDGRSERDFEENTQDVEDTFKTNAVGNSKVTFVHKIANVPNDMLGFMFLDHIANVRNNQKGSVGPDSVIEDVFMRRKAILNSELVRRIEQALARR